MMRKGVSKNMSHEGSYDSEVYLPYDVLRIVFRYLNGRDLSSAAMVCRLWLEAANNEKCLRGPYCFTEQLYCGDTVSTKSAERLNFDCMKQSPIKPSIGFCFLRSCKVDSLYNDIQGSIYELLPKNCNTIMLRTPIIYLNNGMVPPSQDMVCALLPQIPNVKISMLVVTDRTLKGDKYRKYVRMIEGVSRQDHKTSTCLMLFCNRFGPEIAFHMASIAKLKFDNNERTVSLCGSLVDNLQINNETVGLYEPYCVALLITGSIQTWSIVLEKCLTTELVKEKLKLFKEQVKLQKYSVGFMFSSHFRLSMERLSVERLSMERLSMDRLYMEDNNLTIFNELFPKVSLVGCYTGHLFGRDTIYKAEFVYPLFKHRNNEYSTTFMILTYG